MDNVTTLSDGLRAGDRRRPWHGGCPRSAPVVAWLFSFHPQPPRSCYHEGKRVRRTSPSSKNFSPSSSSR